MRGPRKPPQPTAALPNVARPSSAWLGALRERKLVAVAEVARPHGIVGEVRLKVYNAESDLLVRRPYVRLVLPDGTEQELAMVAVRAVDKALLVRFSGVDDRNAAEALRGAAVCVPRSALPPPEDGEFYAWDVEGARAVLPSGEVVGVVAELASYPTCDVLVIARDGGKRIEVPLVEAYVSGVDVDRGVVELVTLEGLE
jgi:16S rRNA processing protein RimM